MNKLIRFAALALVAVGLAACKKEPPPPPPPPPAAPKPAPAPPPAPVAFAVSSATLGSAIGPDKKVTTTTESFGKKDTIYVSLETVGAGKGTIKGKFTFTTKDGKTVPVKEEVLNVEATGPATHELHISKPDGWPVGDYQVEVLQDDKVVQTKKFSVK